MTEQTTPTNGARTPRPRRKVSRPSLVVLTGVWFGCVLIGVIVLIVLVESMRPGLIPAALIMLAVMPIALAVASSADAGRNVDRRLSRMQHQLDAVTGSLQLSDSGRHVLARRHELELLRRAIDQDIAEGAFDSANVLVRRLAEVHGARADAEELRLRIEQARATGMDRSVHDAVEHFEEVLRNFRWTEAYAEAARLERLYPESPRVVELRERVDTARLVHRRDLERRFLNAADGDNPEEALTLLKELDQYLTPADAPRYEEAARRVIARAREQLGDRFKHAVKDHHWAQAVTLGQQLMTEFPNSHMSDEVREMMPMLQERASG